MRFPIAVCTTLRHSRRLRVKQGDGVSIQGVEGILVAFEEGWDFARHGIGNELGIAGGRNRVWISHGFDEGALECGARLPKAIDAFGKNHPRLSGLCPDV